MNQNSILPERFSVKPPISNLTEILSVIPEIKQIGG
jgi:hypothetical protein